mgnify:CR=1 FL=1
MTIEAQILLDSVTGPGRRLTTWELTYPRFIHSEFMTHRVFSRNAASSRAIPVEKMIERVLADPAMPVWWGRNERGMQARAELTGADRSAAQVEWLMARDSAVEHARRLQRLGAHKQIVNRVIEPWMHITVIATATDHANFFHLRCHPDAEPNFQVLARAMREMYEFSQPVEVAAGDWHLPLVRDEDRAEALAQAADGGGNAAALLLKLATARCARVSYLTHDGQRDLAADLALHDRLVASGHWSPFEHAARALSDCDVAAGRDTGNLRGWLPYRKLFADECVRG